MSATPRPDAATPSVGQLRRARPEQVAAVVGLVQAAQARAAVATRHVGDTPPGSWWGGASDAASRRRGELHTNGILLGHALDQVRDRLQRVVTEVSAAQTQLARAEAWAHRHGLVVAPDGVVVQAPGAVSAGPVDPAPARAVAVAVRDALQRYAASAHLLTDLATLPPPPTGGRPGSGALATVALVQGFGSSTPDPGDGAWRLAPVPPLFAGPQAAAGWFGALGRADQERVVSAWPEWAGGTDGLPGWARDRANRVLLVQRLAEVQAQRAGASGELHEDGGEFGPGRATRARTLTLLGYQEADLLALQQVLAAEPPRERQLLVLDASGPRIHAAVSTGDVDTAGHLAVFVPGFRTSVASHLAGYDARNAAAADLATRLAREHGDGTPVVAITWHGYPAPQTGEVFDPDRSVLSDDPARDGAARLAPFVTGLQVAGARSIVLWGHSYGSLVCGIALRDHRAPATALAAFGSPGLGVTRVADLGLPAGRLYVAEAAGDPVADAAAFGADPATLTGVVHLATNRSYLPDGSTGAPSLGHESYLAPGSTSAWNLAAVAAGTTQLVRSTGVCHSIDILRPCG